MLNKSLWGTASLLLALSPASFTFAQGNPATDPTLMAASATTAPLAPPVEMPMHPVPLQAIPDPVTATIIEEAKATSSASPELTTSTSANPAPAEPADIVLPQNLPADIPAYVPPQIMAASHSDLWQRIRDGFGMSPFSSPLITNHETWYASRAEYFQRMTDRSARYLFYIVEEVQKRGMPTEIALLPMIESAYNPQAYSRSQAAGIWQFVPATGKQYGLQQNWWYDGRRDVLASTRSALNYLEKLHRQFGNWELALAAYNCGEGTVGRAIAANAAQGLPTDYKSLALPDEARNYVPKLLAVKKIIAHPEQYGFALLHVPNAAYFTTIDMRQHMDTKLAADFAMMTVNDFTALNPGYNKPVMSGHSDRILLPVDRVETFVRNLSQYSQPLVSWQVYQAANGQKLEDIAQRFNTSISNLRAHNPIDEKRNKLHGAHTLLVPIAFKRMQTMAAPASSTPTQAETALAAETTTSALTHTVVQGDSLYAIARRYGMKVDDLMAINNLDSHALKLGQVILLEANTAAAPTKTVIAAPPAVHAITGATVIVQPTTPATTPAATAEPTKTKQKTYVVQYGDTVSAIARQFGVGTHDLLNLNNLSPTHMLKPGMMMKISASN